MDLACLLAPDDISSHLISSNQDISMYIHIYLKGGYLTALLILPFPFHTGRKGLQSDAFVIPRRRIPQGLLQLFQLKEIDSLGIDVAKPK